MTISPASGVLISEYPPGTEPKGHHFLEAQPHHQRPERGGGGRGGGAAQRHAEHGASRPWSQSRDVYAVPGPVDAPCSQGCNRLIQEGAGPRLRRLGHPAGSAAAFSQRIERYLFDLPPSIGRGAAEKGTAAQQEAPAEDAVPAENEMTRRKKRHILKSKIPGTALPTTRSSCC